MAEKKPDEGHFFQIKVESLPEITATLTNMRDDLDAFAPISGDSEMSHELARWQVEDMHRKYPNTTVPDPWSVFTLIWPRSRKSKPHRPHIIGFKRGPYGRGLPRLVRPHHGVPTAHRPILRPVLFERLVERMGVMMAEKLKWRLTSQR